jgi:hypothetical protein
MLLQIVFGSILAVSVVNAGPQTALYGRVSVDAAPVAGAIVTVSNRGFLKSVTTGDNGRFVVEPLPAGRYDFRTSVPGYAIFERSVIVHAEDSHRNWIDVKDLMPADQQTVSIFDLVARKQGHHLSHWYPLAALPWKRPHVHLHAQPAFPVGIAYFA